MATEMSSSNEYDVIVIGAGISGINAGFRLQDQIKDVNYCILENRGGIGGTWDFFKYPGIRSDSDLQTFGFPWRPWTEQKSIADGASIVKYIKDTAALHGIDKRVRFHHRMLAANWSNETQKWRLDVQVGEAEKTETKQFYASFIIMSTGYYSYDEPLATSIPGLENFTGTTVHPQFWPSDLDYAGKKIVVLGSGATAVTLLPELSKTASHVTMLQRSPGYLINMPGEDNTGWLCKKIGLPDWITFKIVRFKFLVLPFLFFHFCRNFPNAARKGLQKRTMKELPANIPHDPHFSPTYKPWEQRMCVAPDGDFYQCLRDGTTSVATGRVKTMHGNKIILESGQELEADVLVTATGLKIQIAGGAKLYVDNEPIIPGKKFMWKGVMLQDLPNACFVLGYTNASWTLGADATAQHVCRLINHMKKQGLTSVRPELADGESPKEMPLLNLNSTYVQKAGGVLPMAGDAKPWKGRSNYFVVCTRSIRCMVSC